MGNGASAAGEGAPDGGNFRHEQRVDDALETNSNGARSSKGGGRPPPPPPKNQHSVAATPQHDDSDSDLSDSDSDSDSADAGQQLALELFELIPYCNMGDSHTDNLVLSSLASGDVDWLTVDDNGNTLLMIGCQYKISEACNIMIEQGADVNTRNTMGASPLHFACADGTDSLELADLLIRHGANVNTVETSTGCTPLHYAALIQDVSYIQLLLRTGANPLAQDHEDYLPLDYANDVYLSENITTLTSAGTAKRQGGTAYEAFLDNLPLPAGLGGGLSKRYSSSGSGGGGGGTSGGGGGGNGDGNEIDSLLSELEMDVGGGNSRRGGGGNQVEATESELQDILAALLAKEGVAKSPPTKKSLQRSTTVRCVFCWLTRLRALLSVFFFCAEALHSPLHVYTCYHMSFLRCLARVLNGIHRTTPFVVRLPTNNNNGLFSRIFVCYHVMLVVCMPACTDAHAHTYIHTCIACVLPIDNNTRILRTVKGHSDIPVASF